MATFTDMTGTALGPLTTSWSMPASCSVHFIPCSTCDEAFRGQRCVVGANGVGAPRDHTGCWPPVTAREGTHRHPFLGWGFYSPGLACPTGYTAACTARHNRRPEWDIQFKLHEGETAIGCCPEGYSCTNRNGNTCILMVSTNMPEDVLALTGSCDGTNIVDLATATFPDLVARPATRSDEEIVVQTALALRSISLLAPMFQLNFQSSDLPSSSEIPSETRPQTTPIQETNPPMDEVTTPGDQGLPNTARLGAIIGAVAGGVLLLALAACFIWRRRRRTWRPPPKAPWAVDTTSHAENPRAPPYEEIKYGMHNGWGPVELDRRRTVYGPVELPAQYVELSGLPPTYSRGR